MFMELHERIEFLPEVKGSRSFTGISILITVIWNGKFEMSFPSRKTVKGVNGNKGASSCAMDAFAFSFSSERSSSMSVP